MIRLKISWGALLLVPTMAFAKIPSYDRSEWKHWIDEDKDCQDTRVETLISDSLVVNLDDKECHVDWGVWIDEYSGDLFFNPIKLDIDHIVPLKNAHNSGGWKWSASKKEAFANDPANLKAVYRSENRSKGFKSLDQWLPSNTEYWCEYIEVWTDLKKKYKLSMTTGEKKTIKVIGEACTR